MIITPTQLSAMESDGWAVTASLWTADGESTYLRRGDEECFVMVADASLSVEQYSAFASGRKAGRQSRSAPVGSPMRRRLAAATAASIAELPSDLLAYFLKGISEGMGNASAAGGAR